MEYNYRPAEKQHLTAHWNAPLQSSNSFCRDRPLSAAASGKAALPVAAMKAARLSWLPCHSPISKSDSTEHTGKIMSCRQHAHAWMVLMQQRHHSSINCPGIRTAQKALVKVVAANDCSTVLQCSPCSAVARARVGAPAIARDRARSPACDRGTTNGCKQEFSFSVIMPNQAYDYAETMHTSRTTF